MTRSFPAVVLRAHWLTPQLKARVVKARGIDGRINLLCAFLNELNYPGRLTASPPMLPDPDHSTDLVPVLRLRYDSITVVVAGFAERGAGGRYSLGPQSWIPVAIRRCALHGGDVDYSYWPALKRDLASQNVRNMELQ